MESGQSFGEAGMLTHNRRLATIVAREDCVIATLSSLIYKNTLANIEREKLEKKIQFILPVITPRKDIYNIEKL